MPHVIPKDTTEFITYVKSLSYEELQDLLNLLTLAVTNIQVQLEDHVYHKYPKGPNGAVDWEHKTRLALRFATWRMHTAQRVLSTRHPRDGVGKFERMFVEVARALLPQSEYEMLVAETKAVCASS